MIEENRFKMSDVRVSVIIPHKDDWDGLAKLLETIPSRENLEVIVVDDHSETSPNNTKIKHPNMVMVHNDRDAVGAGAARNCGMAHARGGWLLFADADDTFMPGAFDVIESCVESDSDVVYFRPTSVREGTDKPSNRHTAYAALVDEFCLYESEWIRLRFHPPWSKMVRKDHVLNNGFQFDETLVANDLIFSLKIGMAARKVNAVQETIYCVTSSSSKGLSNKKGKKYFDIRFRNHVRYNQLLKDNGYRKSQMSMLSLHRKALRLGLFQFITSIAKAILYRQPFRNHSDYAKLVRDRQNLNGH